MNTLTKALLTSTLLTAPALAADSPSTQPATRPAPAIAQSNAPLIIPDGTTPQNPGPAFVRTNQINPNHMLQIDQDQQAQPMFVFGLRG